MLYNEYEFKVRAGIGIRSAVRNLLQTEAFILPTVRWRENKKLLSSEFSVRGPATHMRNLEIRISEWLKGLGKSTGPR